MEIEQKTKSVLEIIKDKAYHIINKFEEIVPKAQPYADFQ